MPKPTLLSGGNPQIAKGYGEAPIRAYLDAVPDTGPGGWKHAVCRRIDAIVTATVPGVRKAVKWNTPLYAAPPSSSGAETKDHFFLSFHCTTNYVKIGFFRGADLSPPPPEASKQANIRYLHVHEVGEELGDRFTDGVKQASVLPGQKM